LSIPAGTYPLSSAATFQTIHVPTGATAAYWAALNGSPPATDSAFGTSRRYGIFTNDTTIELIGTPSTPISTAMVTSTINRVKSSFNTDGDGNIEIPPMAGFNFSTTGAVEALYNGICSAFTSGETFALDLSFLEGTVIGWTPSTFTNANRARFVSIILPDRADFTTIVGGNDSYNGAFENFAGLKSITIPDSVTTIGARAFYGCAALEELTLPDAVTTIAAQTFVGCTSLRELTIPAGVTSIGQYAFQNCTGLEEINIPEGVPLINNYVFQNCSSLAEITIPASVATINYNAFFDCASLVSVTFLRAAPPSFTNGGQFGGTTTSALAGTAGASIHVLSGSLTAYTTTTSGKATAGTNGLPAAAKWAGDAVAP
jgi:hypothetical protein